MKKIVEFFKKINWKDIPAATYVRYILMIITIANMLLTRFGLNPINVSEDQLYQVVSDILTAAVFIVNTWHNNSVTPEAISADRFMKELKTGMIDAEPTDKSAEG